MIKYEDQFASTENGRAASGRAALLSKVLEGLKLPLVEVLDQHAPTRNMPAPPGRQVISSKEATSS